MNNLSTAMAVIAANNNQLTVDKNKPFTKFINLLKSILFYSEADKYGASLEAYIMLNNPQTPHDIEMLEREFDRKRRDLDIYSHLR
jgi:hypothetical protein